jgi:hypothetical protein
MATIIQIKRSEGVTAPTTAQLVEAEMAYSQDKTNDGVGAKLYIESLNNAGTAVIHAVGGKYYTDIVDAATNANTASTIVKRDGSGNFTAGTITAALIGNASTATSAATLTTARNIGGVSFNGSANIDLPGVNTAGNQNTTGSAATLTTARTIGGVSFDGSANINLPGVNSAGNQNTTGSAATLTTARNIGGVSFDGSANIDLPGVNTTGNQNTTGSAATLTTARNIGGVSFNGSANIDLPGVNTAGNQNTTGSAATLTTARNIGGVSFNGSADINLPGVNSAGNQNTTGSAATLTTARTVAITGDLAYTSGSFDGSANVTGTGTLATVNSNVGTFGSTTAVPVITVNAKGLVTSVTTENIATSFTVAGGSGSPAVIAGGSTLTFAGTANEINTAISAGQVQIGLPDDVTIGQDLSVTRNLVVSGNLTVNGTTTTVATTNTVVSDLLLELGNGVTGSPSSDAGIIIERGTSNNAFMGFDESEDKFIVGTGTFTGASTGNLTITVGTLLANLESSNVTITGGSITGITDLAVADGGTGAGTFTTNGVIFGNGTSALGVTAAGTAGQVLTSGGSGSAPSFANIDGGTF